MKRSLLLNCGLNRNNQSSFRKKLVSRKKVFILSALLLLLFLLTQSTSIAQTRVSGTVKDEKGEFLIGVGVKVKNSSVGSSTDSNGRFAFELPGNATTLVFTYVGYTTKEVAIDGKSVINVQLSSSDQSLTEVVVTGYGRQTRESITGAISTVTSNDLGRVHGGSNVSTGLAGKLPGVTFRMPDGRPGASANIQIRNMGQPLYVIDGIQQDAGQFNNLAPNDIESITILKDASAAIYGVRAGNGVVVVTTKQGKVGARNAINIDAYAGGQNWTRFLNVLDNSYDYMRYRADAEVNGNIFNPVAESRTAITPEELQKYKEGTEPGYQSFDWKDFVLKGNAPLNSVNINATGGSDKLNYYLSGTNLYQNSVLGREYKFNRTNIQSNITSRISSRLKVGVNINGRIESRENPGVPGGDDYFLAKFAIIRNTPRERPYANDNPEYLNDIKHTESNWAYLNYKIAGRWKEDWRVLQTNFTADYEIPGIKGLTAKGTYSYYFADQLKNNHEFTYNAYTYIPATDTYERTGGSTNPWREREQKKEMNYNAQAQLNYNNTFGKHTIGALLVTERIKKNSLRNWVHSVPTSNALGLIYFPTADTYDDSDDTEKRVGYIGRVNYSYSGKYYLEGSIRRDASYLFAPNLRVGYFPSVSAGWRITEESFMKNLVGDKSILSDLKIRGSYGILGDDRNPDGSPILAPFSFIPGYNYNPANSDPTILDGNSVTVSRDKGLPTNNISWTKSKITDIGIDFALLNNKLTGAADWFKRDRSGLLAVRNDVLLPVEFGFGLPAENLNSDAVSGEEISLNWASTIGALNYNIGGNASYARGQSRSSYNPTFFNSWDQYRSSTINRYSNISWGQEVIGQFESQEQINTYPVNIDNRGNTTLIPGDLIYKDQNNDGVINDFDNRPIGFGYNTQPNINFGFNIGFAYKGIDFHADFSGAAGYTWYQNWETRRPFQNDGNLNTIFEDRWHRADPFDVNSEWIPGKYPANRINFAHSDYDWDSTFWLHNANYLRARTIEIGYSLPAKWLSKFNISRTRIYANGYNLFTFDNLKSYDVDPEIADDNGLQYPQSKFFNIGVNISL